MGQQYFAVCRFYSVQRHTCSIRRKIQGLWRNLRDTGDIHKRPSWRFHDARMVLLVQRNRQFNVDIPEFFLRTTNTSSRRHDCLLLRKFQPLANIAFMRQLFFLPKHRFSFFTAVSVEHFKSENCYYEFMVQNNHRTSEGG
jgi:hypothetical protein